VFDEEKTIPHSNAGFMRVMSYYNPKHLAIASVFISIAGSFAFPLFGYIFSELMFIIIRGNTSPTYIEDRNTWCLNFLYMALGMGIVGALQKLVFSITGENLTYDVRFRLYQSLIYKQISWFDRKEKAPGILTNILSEDITNLNGLTTETLATIIESFIALLAGITLSAFFQWRMAVICILATPFVMIGGVVMARLNYRSGPSGKNRSDPNFKELDPYEESNALLSDVILNYRTIISFGQDNVNTIMDKYESLLEGPANLRVRYAHIAGVAFGYSLCVRLVYIGIVFFVGSKFIVTYDLDP
jgi:ATP-binding cassette, subfamily B (MDR/TAP), member 1